MSSKKNIVIYGVSDFAKVIKFYIDNDTDWNIIGFVCDREFYDKSCFCDLPIYVYEELSNIKEYFEILIAIGYSKMNEVRKRVYIKCKNDGYKITNYIHSSVINYSNHVGEGNIILENTIIGPYSIVGDSNLIWNSVVIAHDISIGNFNMIGGNASICGFVNIKNNCFIGNSSCIKEHLNIDNYALIGANCFINKDVFENQVYKCKNSILLEKKSKEFY